MTDTTKKTRKSWSEAEVIRLRELAAAGLTAEFAGKALDRTESSVRGKAAEEEIAFDGAAGSQSRQPAIIA